MRGWALILVLLVQAWPLSGQLISPGKLARPHAELEGVGNCTKCHTPGARVDDGKCLACHDKLAARIRVGKGYHVHWAERRCADCHSDHRGVEYEMVRWNPESFDHDSTGYALKGGHARVRCDQCHKAPSFLGLETACLACHADTHQGQLAADCLTCRTYEAWKPVPFDHGRARFLLRGKHAAVACGKCHADGRYREIPFGACRDCHADTHQGQFTGDCAACHAESGWKPVSFDHDRARFLLLGRHAAVRCEQCHRLEEAADGPFRRYRPLAFARCSDCHERDFGRARVAVHLTAGPDCESCHTLEAWKGGHDPAWFEIRSGHHEAACGRCHKREEEYASYTCADCHRFSLEVEEHQGIEVQDARCRDCHPHGFN